MSVNHNQPFEVVRLLKKTFGDLSGKNILILGLSFKPQTDDIRESVSLKIINKLLNSKSLLYAHYPVATDNAKLKFNKNIDLTFIDSLEEIEITEITVSCEAPSRKSTSKDPQKIKFS